MVKVVGFAGEFYILSGWDIDRSGDLQRRFWINQKEKRRAATMFYSEGLYKGIIYDPKGELLDVIASQSRREIFNLIRDSLAFYTEEGRAHPNRTSEEFRAWLGI